MVFRRKDGQEVPKGATSQAEPIVVEASKLKGEEEEVKKPAQKKQRGPMVYKPKNATPAAPVESTPVPSVEVSTKTTEKVYEAANEEEETEELLRKAVDTNNHIESQNNTPAKHANEQEQPKQITNFIIPQQHQQAPV